MKEKKEIKWIMLSAIISTLLISLPLLFIANADNRLTSTAFPDSGEIIQNLIQLMDWNYDQTHPSHLALYGWFYNSIIYWEYQLLHFFFKDTVKYYFLYAFLARLNSLVIAASIAAFFPKVLALFINSRVIIFLATLSLIFFHPFSLFSFQVHPDNLGMLLSLISIFYVTQYLQDNRIKNLQKALIFSLLTPACKQYYVLFPLLIFLFMGFLFFYKDDFKDKAVFFKTFVYPLTKALGLALFLLFLIHPYAFLHLDQFLKYQIWLKDSGFTHGMVWASVRDWYDNFLTKDFILMGGGVTALLLIVNISYRFWPFKRATTLSVKHDLVLAMLALYCILHVIYISLTMKNISLHYFHYFLPIYPYCILLISVMSEKMINLFKKQASYKLLVQVCFLGVAMTVISHHFIHVMWQATHYATLPYTDAYQARVYLKNIDWHKWGVDNNSNVFYSTMIPIPNSISRHYINDWAFDLRNPEAYQALATWHPDVMIIDCENPYSNSKEFIKIAKQLGLVLKASIPKIVAYSSAENPDPSHYLSLTKMIEALQYNLLLLTDNIASPSSDKNQPSMLVFVRKQLN